MVGWGACTVHVEQHGPVNVTACQCSSVVVWLVVDIDYTLLNGVCWTDAYWIRLQPMA